MPRRTRWTLRRRAQSRRGPLLWSVLYWLSILVLACILVFVLLAFLESRDEGSVGASDGAATAYRASERASRANTMIRFDALYNGWQALSINRS